MKKGNALITLGKILIILGLVMTITGIAILLIVKTPLATPLLVLCVPSIFIGVICFVIGKSHTNGTQKSIEDIIASQVRALKEASDQEHEQAIKCEYCGATNKKTESRCSSCGAKLKK